MILNVSKEIPGEPLVRNQKSIPDEGRDETYTGDDPRLMIEPRWFGRIHASLRRRGAKEGKDSQTRTPGAARDLLESTGLTAPAGPIFTVTGSKGKGTTTYLIATGLVAAARTPGWITSPHMRWMEERLRVGLEEIDESELDTVIDQLWPVMEEVDARWAPQGYVGPNAILLAALLQWGKERGADCWVLEAGRGARHDDIRAALAPTVGVITPIFEEHLAQLGPTLADVVWEKAGVWAPGGKAVSAIQRPEVEQQLRTLAGEDGVKLYVLGKEFQLLDVKHDGAWTRVEMQLPSGTEYALRLPRLSWHLHANIPVALAALDVAGVLPDPQLLSAILTHTFWPARMQRVDQEVRYLIDCTIHRSSAQALCEAVEATSEKIDVALLALPQDKDGRGVVEQIARTGAHIILTQVDRPTLHFDPAQLQALAQEFSGEFEPDATKALTMAKARAKEGLVLVAGTISFVRWFFHETDIPARVLPGTVTTQVLPEPSA